MRRHDLVRPVRGSRAAGFTLVELLVSLLLLLLALALAAQILVESSQMLADTAAEQVESPLPLAVARLRADVLGSASFSALQDNLLLEGHPAGSVLYELAGDELRRIVLDAADERACEPAGESVLLRGVAGWRCSEVGPRLLAVTIRYRRRAVRPSPLPTLPAHRGPSREERTETLLLAPRGAGLGESW
jgi:prepilin-type N-terminal cleavage/methylation domain-containing protein